MGTKYLLSTTAACGLIAGLSAPATAALLCDTASMSAMEHPPQSRVVSLNAPARPQQVAYISVTARGGDVASVQFNTAPVTKETTRDKALADGVRIFVRRGIPSGEHTVTVTYDTPPAADAIAIILCDGVKPGGRGVKQISTVPTGDRREVLTVTGDDDVDSEISFVGSSGGSAEISMHAAGSTYRSLGATVLP